MPILLSETAAKEIRSIIKDQNLPEDNTRLRVGVQGGGCSGFSYMLDLTEEAPSENDEEVESHGVKILCDMKSYLYLNGTEIYRNNLPAGTVTYTTLATNATDDGATAQTFTLTPSAFVAGNNTLAVEIHQTSGTSTDISFDLQLLATPVTSNTVLPAYGSN